MESLNSRIKYFDYDQSIDVGNRIPLITESHIKKGCIIMSSAEMMSFVTYFSIMVGDLIDREDECWIFYLHLYDILKLCFSDSFTLPELHYLKYIIKQHHELFITLFNERLKPKYHLLTHYPDIIVKVGPLHTLSSMRYEAFHKIGKTNAHIVTSRRNILYTLAIRYQLKLCYRLHFKIGLKTKYELGKTIDCDDYQKNCCIQLKQK